MERRWHSIIRSASMAALIAPLCMAYADDTAATQPTTAATSQPATTLPATLPSAAVEELIKSLSADDWSTRHHSAEVLQNLGGAITQRLRQAAQTEPDVEARSALLGILQRIEEAERIGPTRITLHAHDLPAIDVLTQIGQQASFPISTESTGWISATRITIDVDDEPFWSVMQKLAPQWPGHLAISTIDRERVTLLPSGTTVISAGSVPLGPTMLCPLTLQSVRITDLTQPGAPARFHNVTLQAALLVEPKLHVSQIGVELQEAVDEHQKPIGVSAPAAIINLGLGNGSGSQVIMRLTPPQDVGTMLASLKGVLRIRLPLRRQLQETAITAMDADFPINLAGTSGTARVAVVGDAYQLTVTLDNNAVNRADIREAMQSVTVVDSAGVPLMKRPNLQEVFGRPVMHFMFAKESTNFGRPSPTGPPVKVVSPSVGETRQLSEPFELKNLPLSP